MRMFWKRKKLGNRWTAPSASSGLKSSAPTMVRRDDEYWLVDGTLRLKSRNVGKNTPMASRELRDVSARLKHMDELGVDIQVIFPTIFIIPLTPRPEIELALCRSYNRWMADICQQGQDRLRWVAVPPLLSMDKVNDEAKYAKDNGAVGNFSPRLGMRSAC